MVDVQEAVGGEMARRAVDQIPLESPRSRQMELLCLGLSRTGTMSLKQALNILGYNTYHYNEISQPHLPYESHVNAWMEAFKAKMYGNGKPFGRAEFDRILRNYSAVTDAPCCCFADELISAYPNAKIILNVRKDKKKWLASMETSYYAIIESRKFRFFRAISALDFDILFPLLEGLRYPLLYWTSGDWTNRQKLAQGFDEHYAHVRKIAPADNLLEWEVTDGWEPLCKFLGKPTPDEPFPRLNQGDDVQKLFFFVGKLRLTTLILSALKKPMALGAFGGVLASAYYVYKKYAHTR